MCSVWTFPTTLQWLTVLSLWKFNPVRLLSKCWGGRLCCCPWSCICWGKVEGGDFLNEVWWINAWVDFLICSGFVLIWVFWLVCFLGLFYVWCCFVLVFLGGGGTGCGFLKFIFWIPNLSGHFQMMITSEINHQNLKQGLWWILSLQCLQCFEFSIMWTDGCYNLAFWCS